MKRRHYILVFALLLVLTTCAFTAGRHYQLLAASQTPSGLRYLSASTGQAVAGPDKTAAAGEGDLRPLETFQEVLDDLRQFYVDKVEDSRPLTYGAIRGMLRALDDPYTRFMEAKDYAAFRRESEGHFEGIGATLGMTEVPPVPDATRTLPTVVCPNCGADLHAKSYRITVTSPIQGSPAAKAGLKAGDYILKVDGKSTAGMDLSEAVSLIRGQAGTPVTLTVGRKGLAKPFEVKIVRGTIDIPAVEYKMLPGKVGYLRLNIFNEITADKSRKALDDLESQGMEGLLLDLRNNPGGLLGECVEVARQFVSKGPIVYIEERGGKRRSYDIPDAKRKFAHPMVVLVNKGTASASEILSGAIQDYHLGTIVGTTTYGKGLVQTVMPLSDGSALSLTTARYYTPKGRDINKKGIEPDRVVELPAEVSELATDQDTQYQEALKLLRQEIASLPKKGPSQP